MIETSPNSSVGHFRLIDVEYDAHEVEGYLTGGPALSDGSQMRPFHLGPILERYGKPLHWLQVRGISMQGAGLNPGDLIVVSPRVTPQSGDIVAVLVEGKDPLVKRLRGKTLYSEYLNRRVKEQITDESSILGVMVWHLVDALARRVKVPGTSERL